eukprot:Protomagalhaensia_sp_Gyna_25__3910@NODE_3510_length_554_cov_4_019417_g2958_i0_p1_GENE_NODE_3510_length_554_cov_4_019417_g2958_i0NODE_3510_length_554_cov_4_019417_g2958_i0_p1_ORF_typecomplete_len104_score15_82HVSL/PF09749_9/7e09SPOB_ab/PF14682_6/0_055BET/PF17035_5/0_19_NODE_3510_length_554_cov_4_019417_g2958_i0104415
MLNRSNVYPSFIFISFQDEEIAEQLNNLVQLIQQSSPSLTRTNQAVGFHISLTPSFILTDFQIQGMVADLKERLHDNSAPFVIRTNAQNLTILNDQWVVLLFS